MSVAMSGPPVPWTRAAVRVPAARSGSSSSWAASSPVSSRAAVAFRHGQPGHPDLLGQQRPQFAVRFFGRRGVAVQQSAQDGLELQEVGVHVTGR